MTDESIFAAALAISDPGEQAAYLDRACAGQPDLRREVEELLAAHAADNPLDRPPADLGRTGPYQPAPDDPPAASVGDRIGPYRLMEQIGEGGFGLVFVAEQQEPVRRKVALKVLKPGMDSRDVVARFEAERQALALMDHPHIAKVLDAGSTPAGRPYFAMELVRGVPITDYCDQNKLPPRERLALFVQVCQAVQHAHQKGIIHRDIKPGNVLVAPHDGVPVVKVIDFGVAKALGQSLTEKTIYTRFAQMIGTPLYMSPEQAEINQLDVDTRADVYALGVLLYELLTGTTPFDKDRFRKAAFDEIRRIIREEEPPRPSTRLSTLGATLSAVSANRKTDPEKLAGLVRGELDWIVMRCLEKDRNRRYDSAVGLAKDVQRYLAGDTVEACPPTLGYRLRKTFRRHKAAVLIAAGFAAVLLLGIAMTAWQAVRATRAEANAAQQRDEAVVAHQVAATERDNVAKTNGALRRLAAEQRRTLYATSMNLAQAAWETGNPARTFALLRQWVPQPGEDDLRGFEWHYWNRFAHQDLKTVRLVGFDQVCYFGRGPRLSPDGTRVAAFTADAAGTTALRFWDTETGKVIWSAPVASYTDGYPHMAFSRDGRRLVTARRLAESGLRHVEIRVWDTATGKPVYASDPPTQMYVVYPTLSPDGSLLALVLWGAEPNRNPRMSVRRIPDGKEVFHFPPDNSKDLPYDLTFSPDGKRLAAVVSPEGSFGLAPVLKLWDPASGRELWQMAIPSSEVWGVAFSPDGARVATAIHDGPNDQIIFWDSAAGTKLQVLDTPVPPGPFAGLYPVAFDPSGQRLALREGAQVYLMDAAPKRATNAGPVARVFRGHEAPVWDVVFGSNGSRLVTLDLKGVVKQWDPAPRAPRPRKPLGWRIRMPGVLPNPDGTRVVLIPPLGDPNPRLRLTYGSGRMVGETVLPRGVSRGQAFSLDGRTFAMLWHREPYGSAEWGLVVWDALTGKEVRRLVAPAAGQFIGRFALSPDGSRIVTLSWPASSNPAASPFTLVIWETATGRMLASRPGGKDDMPSWSPDGRWIVSSDESDHLVFRDARTGEVAVARQVRKGLLGWRDQVAFSRDGRRLAVFSAREPRPVTVWETDALLHREAPEPVITLTGHGGDVGRVEFSPDGRRILTSGSGVVKLWDAASGREILTLKAKGLTLDEAFFSPDGNTIWGGLDENGRLWGWDGTPVPEEKP